MTTATITTMEDIRREMTDAGSHWWDRSSMRSFGTRVGSLFVGPGGIYFTTSEQPPYGARKHSVRQYNPATKQISTVGEFCSMSATSARNKARHLSGANDPRPATLAPVTPAEQLAIDIVRGGGTCTPTEAEALIRLSKRHHKLMEDYCNGVELHDKHGNPLPKLTRLRDAIDLAAQSAGCRALYQSDPRGCTVKLVLPSGETDDWEKEGWCVPTE